MNVDKNNSNNVYAEYQWGNLFRSTDGGDSMEWALSGINPNDRTNWNTPVEISPFNTNVLYYGSNKLYKSTNKAVSWNVISNDLTSGQHPSGSTAYGTLTCMAPSYNNLNVIYTGSDDGNVSVTIDAGATWQSIDDDLPNRFVSQIAIHPNDDMTAYVTFSGYRSVDYTPYIYKTIDGGLNWIDITGNLPSVPVNDIVISASDNKLYVATDTAVWYSENEGVSWELVGANLPIGIVADIKIHEPTHTLYAGTFGRSMFSIDLNTISAISETRHLENQIKIFPNPIHKDFTITFNFENLEMATIVLTDTQGKIVANLFKGKIHSGVQQVPLQIQGVTVGIYYLRIQTSNETLVKKVIIKSM